ncbi:MULTISPECIES: RIP metalloprotease RseP [Pseudomonas]|uniref:Zinc metalloprotease n=2 Tax=Pseudomonas TaxID=286 RepID=A0A178LPC7_9PSED|nr:RIP metalloprotease RseP [Pseudomonas oryzihabitans]MXS20467.1 RIP metalloprotease RseP [Pseudomonas oryzihabitans]OAN32415.1 zinc metallopeptidase RseP [Pseudomonas oryzihabitans]
MSILYTILGTLIALGVLVTIHEYGHFWTARRCGVKVLRFSVGFGKPLLRWHDRHGTEFVVAAIPLGGYVKMLDEREAPVAPEDQHAAFNRKTVRQRIAIVAAGPIANFLLAILFFWVLAMLGSQQPRPVVGGITPDTLAATAGIPVGAELTAVDDAAVDSWSAVNLRLVDRLGESGPLRLSYRVPGTTAEQRTVIQLDAWLRGAEDPDPIQALGLKPWRPQIPAVFAELDPAGPAKAAGLQTGDRLIALNDTAISDWQQAVDWVRAHPDQQVKVTYEREGQRRDLSLRLGARRVDSTDAGYLGAGVAPVKWPAEMVREISYGPVAAVGEGIGRTWQMSVLTLVSLKKMLLGELSVKNLSGPITIAKVAGASAQSGLGDFLNFLAYLSISLGVLNLLPIPVLDGGHLVFYFVEWIRGRPLSERVQTWGMQIGISLVVGVMLLALVNDLGRL